MAKASRGETTTHIRLHLADCNRNHGVTANDMARIEKGDEVVSVRRWRQTCSNHWVNTSHTRSFVSV